MKYIARAVIAVGFMFIALRTHGISAINQGVVGGLGVLAAMFVIFGD
jgi:hypothetical protein